MPYRKIQIIKRLLFNKYLVDINIVLSKNNRYTTTSFNYCFKSVTVGSCEWQVLHGQKETYEESEVERGSLKRV